MTSPNLKSFIAKAAPQTGHVTDPRLHSTGWSWDKKPDVSGLFKPEGVGDHRYLGPLGSLFNKLLKFMLPPRYILLPARPLPCSQPHANGSRGNICDASGASRSQLSTSNPQPPGGARTPSGSHSGTRALRGTLKDLGEWRLGAAQPYTSAPPSWTGGFDQALHVTGCRPPKWVSQALLK